MSKKGKTKIPVPTSDNFLRGYLECILFTGTDESDESGGQPLDKNYSINDFSDEALARATKDCNAFLEKAGNLLDEIPTGDDEQNGMDFWYTRNGHGVGFWDRDYDKKFSIKVEDELTKICKSFGECWSLIGDDGKIHLS